MFSWARRHLYDRAPRPVEGAREQGGGRGSDLRGPPLQVFVTARPSGAESVFFLRPPAARSTRHWPAGRCSARGCVGLCAFPVTTVCTRRPSML